MKTPYSILQNNTVYENGSKQIEDVANDETIISKIFDGYQGELLYNSLHGCGRFKWLSNNGLENVYNGHFFVNDLEGYGRVTYSSGGNFEGLFKRSRRFGPGVFTHPYGFQDVGLWNGNYLIRLSCHVNSKIIPQLAFSPNAKYRLLKFRKLVTICPEVSDKAPEILAMLDCTEDLGCTVGTDGLYNNLARNRDSTFLDRNLFNKLFFGCKSKVEVSLSAEEEKDVASTITKRTSDESGRKDICIINDKEIKLQELNKYVETMTKLILFVTLKIEEIEKEYSDMGDVLDVVEEIVEEGEEEEDEEERDDDEEEEGGELEDIMQLLYNNSDLGKFLEAVPWLLRATSGLKKIYGSGDYGMCFDKIKDQFIQKLEDLLSIATYNREIFVTERDKLLESMAFAEEEEEEVEEKEKPEQKSMVKILNPSDILAWNNEEIIIDMMIHCFLHQDMEEQVSCDVLSVISGNRAKYKQRGPYEEDCLLFLQCCSAGSVEKINKLSCKYINPDISDCKGNTGMFAAVSNDNIDVIRALGDLGAAVNIANDECLTPLTLSLCKYLSIFHKVTNWELAFLPPPNKNQLELNFQWYPSKSLDDFLQNPVVESDSEELHVFIHKAKSVAPEKVNDFSGKKQKYLMSTECVRPPPPKKRKEKKKKKGKKEKKKKKKEKSKTKSSRSDRSKDSSGKKKGKRKGKEEALRAQHEKEMLEMQRKLDTASSTISVLLEIGADPNFGDVPLPPLILALFSNNVSLISKLLSYNANPNIRCREKNMTPLHYLASKSLSVEDPKILRTILQYQANPNSRTDSTHWTREAQVILVNEKLKNVIDPGKTALHILSMRYDYFQGDNQMIIIEMVRTLSYFGANTELQYFGHTPLTLAMLRGNIQLVDEMLKTNLFNSNQILGRNMGVPLTVLLLPSYVEIQPPNISKSMIETLIQHGANPLNIIGDYGNAIEFLTSINKPPKSDKKSKSKKKKKGKSSKSSKKSKKSRKAQLALIKFFKDQTRKVLIRNIQAKCVKYLFIFVSEYCLQEQFIKNMARLVSVEEAFKIIQLLIENKRIKINENCKETCRMMLRFIEDANQVDLSSPRNIQSPKKSKVSIKKPKVSIEQLIEDLKMIIKPYETNKYFAYPPELDKYNKKKYYVCFNCCCSLGKDLVVCPQCCMVYFCSEACNKQSNSSKTIHKCGGIFYKSEKDKLDGCRELDIPYESPLERKLKWIADLIRERKLNNKLRKRALKEYEMIYGKVKEGKDNMKKLEQREKFIQEKIIYYKKVAEYNDKGIIKQKESRGRNIKSPTRKMLRYNSPVNNNDPMVELPSDGNHSRGDKKKVINGFLTANETQKGSLWSSTDQGTTKEDKWNSNGNQTTRTIHSAKDNTDWGSETTRSSKHQGNNKNKFDTEGDQAEANWSPKRHIGGGGGDKDKKERIGKESNNHENWNPKKRQINTQLSRKHHDESMNILDSKGLRLKTTSGSKSRDGNTIINYEKHKNLPDTSFKTNEKQNNRFNAQQSSKKQTRSSSLKKSLLHGTDIDKRRGISERGQLDFHSQSPRLNVMKQSPRQIPKDLQKFLPKNAASKLGKLCRQGVHYQGLLLPSKLPSKFQILLEKLTEHMSEIDLKRLLLPYSCFTGDQLYFRFKRSSLPTCGTYSDV